MPLFGRQRPPQLTEAARDAAAVDLERIERGGIPLGAEERLKRVAGASTPFFTSDLSVKEYALAQAGDLQPLAQVMGSSVVQHGWASRQVAATWGSAEVSGLSEPWNLSRGRAFARLREEAQLAGAHAVIGIEMSSSGSLEVAGAVEYVVFGTAVRDKAFPKSSGAAVASCSLSGQDVYKLRRLGAEICDVIGRTTVIAVQLQAGSNYLLNSSGILGGAGAMNAEVPEISAGVYQARHAVMAELRRQATAVHANNIVISTLRHSIDHFEYEGYGGRVHYFYVTMHVLGTAIRLGAHPPHPAPIAGPQMSIDFSDRQRQGGP